AHPGALLAIRENMSARAIRREKQATGPHLAKPRKDPLRRLRTIENNQQNRNPAAILGITHYRFLCPAAGQSPQRRSFHGRLFSVATEVQRHDGHSKSVGGTKATVLHG